MAAGKGSMDWVRLFYTDTKAQLIINGNITPSITPERGLKQGYPLSVTLPDGDRALRESTTPR